MKNELLEWAKKYRAVGWNVLPLYNFSKNPAPIRWKEFEDRMATDAEIEAWFSSDQVTGLGLVTGKISGVVVLDEDSYKEGIKVKVKTGMLAETARHGKHHYFRYVEPIKSSGLRAGIYVEIKADGGFVVLPPSKVKIESIEGEYAWLDTCMPEDLVEIHEVDLAPYRGDSGNTETINVMDLTGAAIGTQHNNLRSICLSLFARFRKEEWSLAEEIIRQKATEFDPPHPEARVTKMIQDTKRFIETHNKKEIDNEIAEEPVISSSVHQLIEERLADRELEKLAPKTGWPDLDHLIKGFVPGHIYTFTGDTNVGKTTIACNFAEALRQQKKKVLYIALEPDIVIVDYLASVRNEKRFEDLTNDDLYIRNEKGEKEDDGYIQVYLQRDIKKVDDLIRSIEVLPHADLIIIDHIGYFVRNETNWVQEQSNIIKQLAFLAKQNKTAVMMIAHLRKPNTQKKGAQWVPTHNDIAGSAAFKQDSTEVLIAFRPTKTTDEYSIEFENHGVLLVTKTKCGPNGKVDLYFEAGSAKVCSDGELRQSPEGYKKLQEFEKSRYERQMYVTQKFDEVDN